MELKNWFRPSHCLPGLMQLMDSGLAFFRFQKLLYTQKDAIDVIKRRLVAHRPIPVGIWLVHNLILAGIQHFHTLLVVGFQPLMHFFQLFNYVLIWIKHYKQMKKRI